MEISLKNKDFKPSSKNYYLVAKNGIFLCKENNCFSASVKADEKFSLDEHSEMINWKLPMIPCRIVYRAICFFRYVKSCHQSEGLLWIYYSLSEKAYSVYAPAQKATSASVSTEDKTPTPDGWLKVGTMHSHPGDAFHSGGDDKDERHSDGLHITVGNLQKIIPDFSCSCVVEGKRFIVPTESVLDIDTELPKEFINNVGKRR